MNHTSRILGSLIAIMVAVFAAPQLAAQESTWKLEPDARIEVQTVSAQTTTRDDDLVIDGEAINLRGQVGLALNSKTMRFRLEADRIEVLRLGDGRRDIARDRFTGTAEFDLNKKLELQVQARHFDDMVAVEANDTDEWQGSARVTWEPRRAHRFRLRHLAEPRARAVLGRAAAMAEWGRATIPEGRGRGLALARYKNTGAWCAVVAEIDVEEEPRATQLWIAVDVGEAINPDGVVNQIEGGAIQAVSWTLKEEVAFTREEVTSASWESYPILRFSEVPAVSVEIMPGGEHPPLGAGEAAHGPTAAALANAIHSALGVRVRRMPITRERIISAME